MFVPFSKKPVVDVVNVPDEHGGIGGAHELDTIVPFPLSITPPSFAAVENAIESGFNGERGDPESGIRLIPLSATVTATSIVEAPLFCCWS